MTSTFMRTHDIQFRRALKNDREKVISLLDENSLPVDDIDLSIQKFIIAVYNSRVIGSIGIEIYGENALLRSLAVQKNFRGKKIAHDILNHLLEFARQSKVGHLHLLTTTAKGYFQKHGFIEGKRDSAPLTIQSSKEFSFLCPTSSTYMIFDL